jgi:hypothetical protein|tara:strand:- start:112 stop:1239 length:1128 start_codon:yes stop_codon:yes gene_type:complete
MDQILNIDNNETKKVGISNESSGITGSIDFLSDNNSDKSVTTPIGSPMAKPVVPNLGVADTMGISLFGSTEKKEEEKPSVPNPIQDESFIPNIVDDEFKPIHRMSATEIKNEKIDYIYKFKKLGDQGIRTTMNYNMNSNLDEMRNEYLKLKKQREIDNSVKFQRKILMAGVTGLEFLNNKFDPFSVNLDGWSESVNEGIYDYDEMFEELYAKYGGGDSEVAPELRLLFALGSSAFMFHLQNTMFKSSLPGMDDILKQNPDLMKQFASAAVGSMNAPGGGGAPPGMEGMMRGMGMMPPSTGPRGPPQQMGQQMGQQMPQRMNQRPASPQRPDMDGPDGLDDIIKTMNLEPDKLPDLDNISLISGDTDRKSGITLNL